MKLDCQDMREILAEIRYKNWVFHLGTESNGRKWLQVRFRAANSYTGLEEWQYWRKWFLSEHMTKSEIVGTAFKAVLSAEEHECRESFKYKNQPIFGPHIDVDVLANIYEDKEKILDSRPK